MNTPTDPAVPGVDDPLVRHFRQVLVWPLQLLPVEDDPDAVIRPWQHLDVCPGPNPWVPYHHETGGGPDDYHERHYLEFAQFLPHVQRFLYGEGREGDEPSAAAAASPIHAFRRHDIAACRMGFADGSTRDFQVDHVELHFFVDADIVILSLEFFADDVRLSRVQEILYRFGRTSPAGWNDDGTATSCLRELHWLDASGKVVASSDLNDRTAHLRFSGITRTQNVGAHWRHLLEPMVLHYSGLPGPLRYRQIEYPLIPRLSYLALDDPFVLDDEDFARLTLCLPPERGEVLPFSAASMDEIRRSMFLDRYWSPGHPDSRQAMRLTCTGQAMTLVGSRQSEFFVNRQSGMLGQFRHQFVQVALIAHFQKAALLSMSDQLYQAISRLDVDSPHSNRRFRERIRGARELFLRFNHRYWFHEVSSEPLTRETFRMWSRHLETDELFQELREETLDMGAYLDSDDVRRQGEAVLRLTVVTILGLVATVATGFLGMNLIDEADNPMSVKIGYFMAVVLPSVFFILVTVRYSRVLADMLDVLADDTIPSWRGRLREGWRVIARRRRRRAGQRIGTGGGIVGKSRGRL